MQLQLKSLYVFLFSLLVVFAGGCRSTTPVWNVEDATVATGKTQASTDDVKNAIVRAGASLGWAMQEKKPGYMTGTLTLRKHIAVVDIKYDAQKYSIIYKDSSNLKYDGTNIHSNYNGWIQRLNQSIQAQLGAAPAMKGQIR